MKVAFFATHGFEKSIFEKLNERYRHSIIYFEPRLTHETAFLAQGFECVCSFANDKLDSSTLLGLKKAGVKLIALRSAGFNHVDLQAARLNQLKVVRVPRYSPYSVAEHAVCLLLALNRKIHRAYSRVRELNFSLEGLVGFDLHGKNVGVIGTGQIGEAFAQILHGFGANLYGFDVAPRAQLADKFNLKYVSLDELYQISEIISLHVPLTKETHHIVNQQAFEKMKPGVFLINTGRGALIDTAALIQNLKSGQIGAAGLDVYEEEESLFLRDLSGQVLQDDLLARLLTFPNVLITAHQGFLTREALENIAETTLTNIADFERGNPLVNEVA